MDLGSVFIKNWWKYFVRYILSQKLFCLINILPIKFHSHIWSTESFNFDKFGDKFMFFMLTHCCLLFNTSKRIQRLWTCYHTSSRGFMVWAFVSSCIIHLVLIVWVGSKWLQNHYLERLAIFFHLFFRLSFFKIKSTDHEIKSGVFFLSPGLVNAPSPVGPPGVRRATCTSPFSPMRACHFLKFSSLKFYILSFLVLGIFLLLLFLVRNFII